MYEWGGTVNPTNMQEVAYAGRQGSYTFTFNIESGKWFILLHWYTSVRTISNMSGFNILTKLTLHNNGYNLVDAYLCEATANTQSLDCVYSNMSVLELT